MEEDEREQEKMAIISAAEKKDGEAAMGQACARDAARVHVASLCLHC